ncbi:MAG: hypothetical protein CMJ64_00480 [Planctomycetaceae bacterium]|nr:hypothetical protein [Planctomycetaceae bacterium]
MSRHHLIKSLSVVGGFLDGLQLSFQDGLNCCIGARGTGKTTVLELVRYAFDDVPSKEHAPEEAKRIETLVKQNLSGGRVQVEIETKDGITYRVSRSWGEEPIVLTAEGEPTELRLQSGAVFRSDIYSQSEIESMADRALSQLDLLDNFQPERIAEIEGQTKQLQTALEANAHRILPLESEIASLGDELATLPSVEEKLKQFTSEIGGDAAPANKAHSEKALRDRERRSLTLADRLLSTAAITLQEQVGGIEQQAKTLIDHEIIEGPNGEAMRTAIDRLVDCGRDVDVLLENARKRIETASGELSTTAAALDTQHKQQELKFREIVEQQEQTRKQAAERGQLDKVRNTLLAKRRNRGDKQQQLTRLRNERTDLLDKLSAARDERFAVRQEVADRINEKLSPNIRVSVRQCGSTEQYQQALERAIKGAGVRQGLVAQKIVNSLPPTEFVELVRTRDSNGLISRGELNADQAAKVIAALSGSQTLYELETVDLLDLPCIELKDGDEYKELASLSTGQRCTTILPILLMESDNPLLIDQPEDNLDNRFIYETIVESVRKVKQARQLIFVTHNPNIPVLGDAEHVFVLQSNGEHARKLNEGTVDECKEDVVELLEGGEEAFKQRRKRYAY